jgi:hypothetical protein
MQCPRRRWQESQADAQAKLEAAAATVDWPWRPKDLEALEQRFNLVVTPGAGKGKGTSAGDSSQAVGAVLTYEGFLTFWLVLRSLMPEVSRITEQQMNKKTYL